MRCTLNLKSKSFVIFNHNEHLIFFFLEMHTVYLEYTGCQLIYEIFFISWYWVFKCACLFRLLLHLDLSNAGISNPAPGELHPADFSSNPAPTHLSEINK